MRDVTVIGQDKTLLAAKREHAALPRMTVIRRDIRGDDVELVAEACESFHPAYSSPRTKHTRSRV